MQLWELTYIHHEFNAGTTTHFHSVCDHFIAPVLTYHSRLQSPLSAAESHSPPGLYARLYQHMLNGIVPVSPTRSMGSLPNMAVMGRTHGKKGGHPAAYLPPAHQRWTAQQQHESIRSCNQQTPLATGTSLSPRDPHSVAHHDTGGPNISLCTLLLRCSSSWPTSWFAVCHSNGDCKGTYCKNTAEY
jgi:hypothetical protein